LRKRRPLISTWSENTAMLYEIRKMSIFAGGFEEYFKYNSAK
jgi:hypothetical protein